MILFKKVTLFAICTSSLLLVLTLNGSFSNFTYSESPVVSDYYTKKYDINQTFHNNCDFLNLCKGDGAKKLNGISSPINNGVVDISYLKIDIDLPFP
ncbi:MAG: hypothetical protein L0H53_04050 [Candidatus Nitrosocosmicus sp.]|nr:hypothetical protein [Candidatus Nitrosocosmicus sp.]